VLVGQQLWLNVVRSTEGELVMLDPVTFKPAGRLEVPFGAPIGTLVAFGSLWVAVEHETERAAWLLRLPLAALEP
jgi:hypothetical protein